MFENPNLVSQFEEIGIDGLKFQPGSSLNQTKPNLARAI